MPLITSANPIVQAEVNLGATPARSGRFTIADVSFQAAHQLYIQMAADVPTGKGTRSDENEMDFIEVRGLVTSAGNATVHWSSTTYVKGNFKFNYRSS